MFASSRSFKPYPNRTYRQQSEFARFSRALFNNRAIRFDGELFQRMKQQLGPVHYRRSIRHHKKNAPTNRFPPLRADIWKMLETRINHVRQGTLLEIYRAILCTLINFDNIFNVYGIQQLSEDMSRLVVTDSEPCNSDSSDTVSVSSMSECTCVNTTIDVTLELEDTHTMNSNCEEMSDADLQSEDVEMVDVSDKYARRTYYPEIMDVEMEDLSSQQANHSGIIPLSATVKPFDGLHHRMIEVIDLTS